MLQGRGNSIHRAAPRPPSTRVRSTRLGCCFLSQFRQIRPRPLSTGATMRNVLASTSLRTMLLALALVRPSTARSQAADANDQQAFRDFLTQAKSKVGGDPEKVTAFYRTTGAFWRAHWLDYSHHPENYADVMALYRADQALYPRAQEARDPERYRKDIEAFKEFDSKNTPPNNAALFVGSSTVMKWKTADAFPGLHVINRGFGGSV